MSYCPECEALVEGNYEEVGSVVPCPECGAELEVVSIDPVEFDLAISGEEEVDDAYGYDDAERDDEEEGADHWDEEDPYSDIDRDET